MEGASDTPRSLRHRLLVFAVAVLAPVVAGGLVSGLILLDSARTFNDRAEEVSRESGSSLALFKSLSLAATAGSAYMDGDGPLGSFEAAARRVEAKLGSGGYDDEAEAIALRRVGARWRAAVTQLRANPPGREEVLSADGRDPEDVFEDEVDAATAGVDRLLDLSETENRTDLADTRRLYRSEALLAGLALLAALALAAFLIRRLSHSMLRPIGRLTHAARALADGELGHRVKVSSSAELQEMATTFNRMASELQRQHEQLERQAFVDLPTGIPNRSLFEDRVLHALERSRTRKETISVLVVDLDDFKLVNDGLGHAAGDALIAQAAERLTGAVRPSDTVARLGGDEFAVLLEGVRGLDDALAAAERLRRAFDAPFALGGPAINATASVGIAMSRESLDGEELLRRADLAMNRAKQRGKNSSAFFDPAIEDRATERFETVNDLRGAVERDELVAHYQPILDLETGDVVAVEALLRWRRPGHGLVSPADFIPLAEETGVIVQLGRWVLRGACAEACRWRLNGAAEVNVCVNVSARQLMDPHFEEIVEEALSGAGLDPAGLTLEVTESSVMQDAELAIAKLRRIEALGVGIVLDDFGEGYSSLSHLRRLPVQGLKIARPFIQSVADGDSALVRGIIELANSLGLRLVAEGIEEPEQREQLRLLGCRLGQGFLFARPLEEPAIRELLARQSAAPVGR